MAVFQPETPGPLSLDEYDAVTPPEGEIWELHEGYVVAFSTGTIAHGMLCTRIGSALDGRVESPCRAFGSSTIGVRRPDRNTNVVPDGAVTCEEGVDSNQTFIVAPKLVVEVISPKSVKRDRVNKIDMYRAMPSVLEYLMIDSRKVWACVSRRSIGDSWLDITYQKLADEIDLLSIDLKISMSHLYRGIDLSRKRKRKGR